ncbi:myb-like protein X [Adelges cooleyi]|uniref:myb-like protein X n=1 Tax=Adelges cooleyi TaxID=133065 RepID=UPI00217F3DBA|nr:myb-like protein X [Adelges cooleyi]
MPPKKKAVPKAKSAGLTTSIENLSNITTRRPVKNDVEQTEETQNLMNEILPTESKNMNVTVVVEKMTDEYVAQVTTLAENDETEKKAVQKKTKPKSKQLEEEEAKPKKGRKRAASEDRTLIHFEVQVVGNSRKRPVNKDSSANSSDTISPLKRGRRAASVDIMPSDNVAVSTKEEIKKSRRIAKVTNFSDEVPKKGRKGAMKDDQPKTEKVVAKGKKTTKKVANEKIEEKEIPKTTEVDGENVNKFSAEVSQEKTKKGVKKGPQKSEDRENEAVEKVSKRTNRAVPKAKQTEDKEVEKKSKRVAKSKQVVQSPNDSEEINDPEVENGFEDKNEENETDCVQTPEKIPVKSKAKQNKNKVEKKSKRVGKSKQVVQSPNESEKINDPEFENDFEEKIDEDEADWVVTPGLIPAKQIEDKELEKKSKRVGKSKQDIKSPNESEENDPQLVVNEPTGNNEEDETYLVVTPVKIVAKSNAKRGGRKEKQNEVENNVEEKETKLQKRRKAKGHDFEEAVEEGSEEKTGDVPSGLPDTPESGKDEVKPVVKRKTKAKVNLLTARK